MYQTTKKRSVYTLTLLLAALIVTILFIESKINFEVSREMILKDKKQLSNIYNQTLDSFYEHYELAGNQLLQNQLVIEAFKNKDRERLYKLVKPFYDNLKSQNKYFYNMHFHTPENISFLRVHKPQRFGDDLSSFRKIVVEANKTKKTQEGIEAGKDTISIRVVVPIIDNKIHYGSVEFGVKINYFLELFDKKYGVKSFYIIHNSNLKELLTFNPSSVEIVSDFSIIQTCKVFDPVAINQIDEILYKGMIKELENNIFLSEISKIYAFGNKPIGHICFNIDMNYLFEKINKYEMVILISFVLFFIVMYIFIHRGFNYFEKVALEHLNKIKELSYKDELTQIYNRKKMIELISQEYNRKQRYKNNISIILFDIDNFKMINDNYGHNIGDEVLKELSTLITNNIRQTDYFARWGGEEFIILVTETQIGDTVKLADKLKELIEKYKFTTIDKVTCSFGVANLNIEKDYKVSIHNADCALYYSKGNGKNQVTVYSEQLETVI